jgi:hypothetical protein
MKNPVLLGLAAALAVPALAAPLASGLRPGESVTPFHPRHVAGPLAGTTECFPCTFQARPQVQVWVNGDSQANVSSVARTLGKAMAAHKNKEFKALVVFLTTPQTAAKASAQLRAAAKLPEAKGVGMALLPTTDEAIANYKVNTSAGVKNTVLVYKDWKVTDSFVNLKADAAGMKRLETAVAAITK